MDIPLFVPIRIGASFLSLRLFRTPSDTRTAVAFSSSARLAEVLGTEQPWTRISEYGLRGLLQDLGIVGLVVDPTATMVTPVQRVA
ncbi:SAV_915 family protein [Acrocarpospora sp. B8E8]|uniref:SAV_915 family protein n=1 Tax=Acrocarpospora sp. B8E8 TaxID=3153572 RepID=UPI00325DBF4A